MKCSFYLLGKKGLATLEGFLAAASPADVDTVYIGRDKNLTTDLSDQIFSLCEAHGLNAVQRGAKKVLPDESDYSLVAGWRWLLPESANCIILHDALLPNYRGFAPLVSMLIEGQSTIGVTAFRAVADYDCGPIIAQRQIDVSYPLKIAQAIEIISELYRELSVEICRTFLLSKVPKLIPQDESLATYSLWRDEQDYDIDWTLDAAKIRRFVDAVGPPYAGARCHVGGRPIRIHEVVELADVCVVDRSRHLGKTIFRQDGRPVVVCGVGLLRIDYLCDDGHSTDIAGELPFRTRFSAKSFPHE
jgi:methionyl-tRNA formyltransferase